MVTERYFVNTLDSKIGVGVEAFPVLTGFTRTSCWFSSGSRLVLVVTGKALVGEINHQEGFTSPDLTVSFVSHASHNESFWFSGL